MNNKDCRIYLDLEYVYPEMTKEYGRPTDKNLRQVIQIAAIKVYVKTNKELETLIAKRIINNEIKANSQIDVDVKDDKIIIS